MRAEQLVFLALVLVIAGIVLFGLTLPKPAPQAPPTGGLIADPVLKVPEPAPQNNDSGAVSATFNISGPPPSCFMNSDAC
jgi:hypothetical protein